MSQYPVFQFIHDTLDAFIDGLRESCDEVSNRRAAALAGEIMDVLERQPDAERATGTLIRILALAAVLAAALKVTLKVVEKEEENRG